MGDVAVKVSGLLFTLAWVAYAVWLPLLFPSGRPPKRWMWGIAILGLVPAAAVLLAILTLHGWTGMEVIDGPNAGHTMPSFIVQALRVSDDLQLWLPFLAVATLIPRYVDADRRGRAQLHWFSVVAVSILVSAFALHWPIPHWLEKVQLVPWVALGIGVPILRHRLFDLDVVIRRSVVYGGLMTVVIAAYALVVGGAAALFGANGTAPAVAAAMAIALMAQPVREALERFAERLVYGGPRDPSLAVAAVGEQLRTADDRAVPDALCRAVVDAARVPGARLDLSDGTQAIPGGVEGPSEAFDLSHAGAMVGTLTITLPAGDRTLGRQERAVIVGLVPVLAPAVHAFGLARELRLSRERLVTAREEERLRLRRDLHDGLGPALAGITLELQAARTIADVDPEAASRMIESAEGWARDAIDEIRRVVYGLRPPVLDQLGLVRAIEQHVTTVARNSPLQLELRTSGSLLDLPAASEVAAYLIALEAITNVVRHAHADRCSVQLAASSADLELHVIDDGLGIADGARLGVGLTSMRERAEELGGSLLVTSGSNGGTEISARLPVAAR